MFNYIKFSILSLIFFTFLLGIIYPGLIMLGGNLLAYKETHGSLLYKDQKVIGSSLIGQNFSSNQSLFQSRPSGSDYNTMATGGSNLAPNSNKLVKELKQRIADLHKVNGNNKKIPEELVFASGSGLDPNISVKAALYQAPRISKENNIPIDSIIELIHTHEIQGFLNPNYVNVLKLNIALLKLNEK